MCGRFHADFTTPPHGRERERGLALLAVAATLLVLGAGALAADVTLREVARAQDARLETARQLDGLRDALVAYARRHGRLPCPALGSAPLTTPAGGDGVAFESGAATHCDLADGGGFDVALGSVPWRAVGVPPEAAVDGWGRRIAYVVYDGNLAAAGTLPGASLVQPGGLDFLACLNAIDQPVGGACVHGSPDAEALYDILESDPTFDPASDSFDALDAARQAAFWARLREDVMGPLGLRFIAGARDVAAGVGDPEAADLSDDAEPKVPGHGAAFVLISRGENGRGARLPGGGTMLAPASPDEQANLDGTHDQGGGLLDAVSFGQPPFAGSAGKGAFDDLARAVRVVDLAGAAGLWTLPADYVQRLHAEVGGGS